MQHAFKSTDLAPDERAAVERLLGRPLESDETVEVVAHKEGGAASARAQDRSSDPRPIWDIILDNMKDVPPEEFAKLPKDGASEHDHYLYSQPKRGNERGVR
jgi:hypothetical protein